MSIDLAAYQPLLTSSSSLSSASLSVNNALGGIDNNALIYGRGISITTSDIWHSFYVNETDGFRYQYSRLTLPTTINRATVQSNSAGSLISYNSNNVTVNNSGVTSTPLTIVTPDTTNGLVIKNDLTFDELLFGFDKVIKNEIYYSQSIQKMMDL